MAEDTEIVVADSDEISVKSAKARTADDYINAANAVIDIAEIAVSLIPGGGTAAAVASKVRKYAPIAKQVLDKAPNAMPVAKQAVDALQAKAPNAVSQGAGKVFGVVKGAASSVGERGSRVGEAIKNKADARAEEKARREARRALLDGAGIRMSVEQFLENRRMQEKVAGQEVDGYLAYSGCYAIATYSSQVKKDDYGAFRDIYVGKSDNIGESIYEDICGKGNVDVYADVKYKQPVHVLLYPCAVEKMNRLEESLITALDADESYNAASPSFPAGE